MSDTFQVRDTRAGFLWINNEIIDHYAVKIGASAFLVYAALTRFANNSTQQSFPSQARIAALSGLSERAVRTALSVLRQKELIAWAQAEGKSGRHHVYTLTQPANSAGSNRKLDAGSTGSQLPPNKTSSNKTKNPSAPDGAVADPRHVPVREFILTVYKNLGLVSQWDGREAITLKRVLKSMPSGATVDEINRMVWNRFRSDVPIGERPASWLPFIGKYAQGPLDRYGKPALGTTPASVITSVPDGLAELRARRAVHAN